MGGSKSITYNYNCHKNKQVIRRCPRTLLTNLFSCQVAQGTRRPIFPEALFGGRGSRFCGPVRLVPVRSPYCEVLFPLCTWAHAESCWGNWNVYKRIVLCQRRPIMLTLAMNVVLIFGKLASAVLCKHHPRPCGLRIRTRHNGRCGISRWRNHQNAPPPLLAAGDDSVSELIEFFARVTLQRNIHTQL